MAKAKTINLLLEDGNLDGLLTVEDSSWDGIMFVSPREGVEKLFRQEETNFWGVYLLISDKEVYTGQASGLQRRIKEHDRGKDFWKKVVLITTKDDSLNRSAIDYIEHDLIDKSKQAGTLRSENKQGGNKTKVSRFDKVRYDNFIENVLLLLELIGIKVFVKTKKNLKKKNINTLIKTISIESEADFKACKINGDSLGSRFKMEAEGNIYNIEINIPGLYNVHNVLGCIACARNLNISMETIKEAVLDIVVPGRCEMVAKNKNLPYTIIVDYAHTPDGLENILNTIRGFVKGKIITVFGCGGDRDKVKRPQMGEIACKLSDIAIITSDNPRSEEPMAIIEDIKNGLAYNNYIVEENRAKAIEKAIDMAKQNDVILIAGKGHETYQILKDKTIHFDEREVIVDILNKKEK